MVRSRSCPAVHVPRSRCIAPWPRSWKQAKEKNCGFCLPFDTPFDAERNALLVRQSRDYTLHRGIGFFWVCLDRISSFQIVGMGLRSEAPRIICSKFVRGLPRTPLWLEFSMFAMFSSSHSSSPASPKLGGPSPKLAPIDVHRFNKSVRHLLFESLGSPRHLLNG